MKLPEICDAALVCTCKGRLSTLKRTLHKICNQDTDFTLRVVLVDYGCPDGTFQYFQDNPLKNLRLIKVLDGTKFFNMSRSRNIGAVLSDARVITFIDADCIVQPEWLSPNVTPILEGKADATCPGLWYTPWDMRLGNPHRRFRITGKGVISVRLSTFLIERGYDEYMQGYGYEDIDLSNRLCARHRVQEANGFPHIALMGHPNMDSVAHYQEKNTNVSCEANRRYSVQRTGLINESGIGTCKHILSDVSV